MSPAEQIKCLANILRDNTSKVVILAAGAERFSQKIRSDRLFWGDYSMEHNV